jgi:Y_Y_Y domain/Histidine kinase
VATGVGVDRLNPTTGRFKHFSEADGLARGAIESAFRDSAGTLWFGATQGVSRLAPEESHPLSNPAVLITSLQTGGAPFPVSQRGETSISRIELEPSRNQLQVEFVAFTEEPEANLRYSYKLEGSDTEWSPPRSQHLVNYAALAPGKYRFQVKAVNSDGLESATPAEVGFIVLPPVWRRWWFEGLALAALTLMVYLLHRYRVSQAVSLERMRTAIATDLHDDIGASLSQIAILSEVARAGVSPEKPAPARISGKGGQPGPRTGRLPQRNCMVHPFRARWLGLFGPPDARVCPRSAGQPGHRFRFTRSSRKRHRPLESARAAADLSDVQRVHP